MYFVIFVVGKGFCMESDFFKFLLFVVGVLMVEYVFNIFLVMLDISFKFCVVVGYREDVMCDLFVKCWVEFVL